MCLIGCIEKFVKFFNKHAYIEIALRSTNFCTSAGNGMKILIDNFVRFGILHGLGEIVMNLVAIFITMIGTYMGYVAITVFGPEEREFHGTAGSLVVIGCITWAVACLFTHIWEVSSDSILHCHCIDDGLENGRPRHSTGKIEEILSKTDNRHGYM